MYNLTQKEMMSISGGAAKWGVVALISGAIVLIVGILFVFLSLQKKANRIIGINFFSFQFFIAAAGILAGVTLLTLGIIFLILALKARKLAKRDIATLATLKEKLR